MTAHTPLKHSIDLTCKPEACGGVCACVRVRVSVCARASSASYGGRVMLGERERGWGVMFRDALTCKPEGLGKWTTHQEKVVVLYFRFFTICFIHRLAI